MPRILRAAILLLILAIPASPAHAQPSAFVTHKVRIEAPEAIARALRADLDLLRWEGFKTMTPDLLERLVGEARGEAREVLAALGYLEPKIETSIEATGSERVVVLRVAPGEPVRVAAVEIGFTGAIAAGDELDHAAMKAVREAWNLRTGAVFTQAGWSAAKKDALHRVSERRYPGAAIASSEARIDPARRTVHLALTIDSGAVVYLGRLRIDGLERYEQARVQNLWTFGDRAPYARELLERFQRRLTATQYFASASADVDPAKIRDASVPVDIAVIEAPTKRLEFGLSFNTDTRLGVSAAYRHQNLFGRAWRLSSRLDLEQLRQAAEVNIDLPERPGGWADRASATLTRKEFENLLTNEESIAWRRASIEERSQPEFGVRVVHSREYALDALSDSVHATLLHYGHTWRLVDDLVSPRRGAIIQLEGGYAPPGISTRAFGRTIARLAWYQPLAAALDLSLQAQGGAILASSAGGVPQSLLFRTGGSTTVRGYDAESLGVVRGNAVLGGRYFGLVSAEAIHWMDNGVGAALFVDAGNAVASLPDFRFELGYGVGARARTPLGPFKLDLAWGQRDRSLKLHFSMGLSF